MNKIILIGNLTRDAEIIATKSGKEFCSFSIAVDRHEKNEDGVNITDFFDVVAWGNIAQPLVQYGRKGKKIGVCGTLTTRITETKDGKRTFYTVRGESFDFLSPKSERKEIEEIPLNDDCPF